MAFYMKKIFNMKIILPAAALIVVTFLIIMSWPLSFLDVISDDVELQIAFSQPAINVESYIYDIQPGTEKFIQIRHILSQYSYHRTLRTFLVWDTSINNDAIGAGYTCNIYVLGRIGNYISSVGTGEILVNGRIYRIGFWGNRKAIKMIDELRSVII